MVRDPTLLAVVAVALIDDVGHVLVQQRPAGRMHGGLWEFPGGKIEPGEGPTTALIREINEELGIAIAATDLFPISFSGQEPSRSDGDTGPASQPPLILLLYGCLRWQGEPRCEPGAALCWTEPGKLRELEMLPLDVPLAAALDRLLKTG